MPVRPAIAVLLAVSLVSASADAAGSCPNERSDAGDGDNLRSCLDDAREARKAGEAKLAAAAYGRAVDYARRAYEAGKVDAPPTWFTGSGEQFVYYGTEGCGLGGDLGPAEARVVYDACVGLLELYIADLVAISAQGTRSGQVMEKRLAEVKALRDALPAAEAEPPPVVTPPTVPPVTPAPTNVVLTPAAPVDVPPPAPRPPPRGLQAGLGVALGVAALSAIGLIGSSVAGRRAAKRLEEGADTTDQNVCTSLPTECRDLQAAKNLYIASGVGLGLGLAVTVVVGALWARDRRARRSAGAFSVLPRRDGLTVGLAWRF